MNELVNYFKERKGFNRLFIELKNKYISLGRYSGSITLKNITELESEHLSNFFGVRIKVNTTFKTSFKEITKKLLETKYKDFNWEELLNNYFEEKILTKLDTKNINNYNEEVFFKEIIDENSNNKYISYLKEIIDSKNDIYRLLKQRYNSNKTKIKSDLNNILLLLNNIKEEPITLPVFSSLTGNPHFLDFNLPTSNLFFRILSFIKNIEYPLENIDKIELLSDINVYIDSLSNYVITYKLVGNKLLDVFEENKQVLNLNLDNIMNLDKVDTRKKVVYIFENPSILNTLKYLDVPIVITSGMPNLALYQLLKKLEESGNKLYYNGDFDPEGLLIASKLKDRFPNLNLFCYDKYDIDLVSKTELNDSRLKKLDNINIKELDLVKESLIKYKLPIYQESNIERIRDFIESGDK